MSSNSSVALRASIALRSRSVSQRRVFFAILPLIVCGLHVSQLWPLTIGVAALTSGLTPFAQSSSFRRRRCRAHATASDVEIEHSTVGDALRRTRLIREEAEEAVRVRFCASGRDGPNIDGREWPWRDEENSNPDAVDAMVTQEGAAIPLLGDALAVLVRDGVVDTNCEVLDLDRSTLSNSGLSVLFQALAQGKLPCCRMFRIMNQTPSNTDLVAFNQALVQGALPECDLLELSGTRCTVDFLRGLAIALGRPDVVPKLRYLYLGGVNVANETDETLDEVLSELNEVAGKRSVRWSYIYDV